MSKLTKIILSLWNFLIHKNSEKLSYSIGILIGVVSLFAIAKPALIELYKGKYGDIEASVIESNPKQLSLIIANNGNTTVAIKKIQITTNEENEPFSTPVIPLSIGERLIKANEAVLVSTPESSLGSTVIKESVLDGKEKTGLSGKFPTVKCTVNIEYVVPGKKSEIHQEHFECYAGCFVEM